MWRKIFKPLPAGEYDLRERMLRSIIQIGGVAAFLGMIEVFLLMEESWIMILVWGILSVVIAATLVSTFKYRNYELAAMVLGFIIIIVIFPIMFCVSGGINSGCSLWMALGIWYIFIMFRGKRLAVFVGMMILSYGGVYVLTYINPDYLIPMTSRQAVYIDSFFSLLVVGCIGGIIYQLHVKVFEEEHKLNLNQKEELKQNSESKDYFFANMSHEIRTPINAILGLNEMIRRTSDSAEILEYAQDIQMAGNMLLNQVNDILDLSKMEVNKMEIVPTEYSTKELIMDLAELVRVQTEKKNLEFLLDIDTKLPSVLYGDEKRLKQILLNILDNAVKYTQEGSVTLAVNCEEGETDEIILNIKISDTGIGIRKENLEGIYDAFTRYDENKNKRILGTGLGLAITKQLVDMMDGEILVDSIYRNGTVFTVVMPQKVVDNTPIGKSDYVARVSVIENEYRQLFEAPEARILIVDDGRMNRLVTKRLLSATKVQTDEATNGAECLQMTKLKYYDVILLDYLLPDMNGQDILRAIRNQENGLCKRTPVIALTGNAISGARQIYAKQGFDGYVEKPIRGRVLESEILAFLPEDMIEYREEESLHAEDTSQMQKLSQRKRKKIYITADCTCDIPQELLEKYDIKLMYLYIKTPYGRFADTREIDSDSIGQYISEESSTAYGDRVSVEEFEEFFAETLSEAEEVIHISLSSQVGKSYSVAMEAARGFDHVHVVDSRQISCGQGLVTLYAAQMAAEGKSANEIVDAVDKMKNCVRTSFVMSSADVFYQNGRTTATVAKICKIFQLHPFAGLRKKRAYIYALFSGNLERAWKKAVACSFVNKRKINTDIVFISHVGCSVKQLDYLQKEILKKVPFKKVITQKTSFTTACSVGMGTIGYAYYTQPKDYN